LRGRNSCGNWTTRRSSSSSSARAASSSSSPLFKALGVVVAAAAATTTAAYAAGSSYAWSAHVNRRRTQLTRLAKQGSLAARIVWHYKTNDAHSMAQKHTACARMMRDTFLELQGVFIKFGQHMAILEHLLPEQYTDAMACMLDQAPRSSYEDVCAVLREDLGGAPEQLFAAFAREPIASASLAQVHIATLRPELGGHKVAVKVQHRSLRDLAIGDVESVVWIVATAKRLFDVDYTWLTETSTTVTRCVWFAVVAAVCCCSLSTICFEVCSHAHAHTHTHTQTHTHSLARTHHSGG
jgi:hypothetical protein